MCDTPLKRCPAFRQRFMQQIKRRAESVCSACTQQKEDKEMVDQEMLMAMSEMMDQKLDEKLGPVYDRLGKLESDVQYVRAVQLENNVIPRLNTIEAYYVDTAKRYLERTEQIDAMSSDIEVMKVVLEEHSKKLNRISV